MIRYTRFFIASLSLVGSLAACSGKTVDLGGGQPQGSQANGPSDAGGGAADSATSTPTLPDAGESVFSFEATAAAAADAGAKAIVVWTVSTGRDYSYAFGSGTTSGKQVFVSFSSPPPAEALNSGTLGVGLVAIVDASANVPEGEVSDDLLEGAGVQVSTQHAIIYRASESSVTGEGWDAAFPQGYSCGRCVKATEGFDSYAVEDCSNVTLQAGDDFCNWT